MTSEYCFICNKRTHALPYICNFCGNSFCSKHRLPENHKCVGLKPAEWNVKIVPGKPGKVSEDSEAFRPPKKRKKVPVKGLCFVVVLVAALLLWNYGVFEGIDLPDLPDFDSSGVAVSYAPEFASKTEPERAFDYLNTLRVARLLPEITWSDNLYDLAVFRSQDMYERNYFSHATPEGFTVQDYLDYYNVVGYAGENIGGLAHYPDGTVDGTIETTIDEWMASVGHRQNLLAPEYDIGAVGCYKYICAFIGVDGEELPEEIVGEPVIQPDGSIAISLDADSPSAAIGDIYIEFQGFYSTGADGGQQAKIYVKNSERNGVKYMGSGAVETIAGVQIQLGEFLVPVGGVPELVLYVLS